MKNNHKWLTLVLSGVLTLSLLTGCAGTQNSGASANSSGTGEDQSTQKPANSDALMIAEQGMFSAGGTVISSDGTFDVSNYYISREGSTSHVDHANVLYQIPEDATGLPMVFLHGYGQSRMGWMTTPDDREGWSDMFLKMGHSVWLIDQPRRGEAGQTPVAGTISTEPSDQTWYTQFRIGTYLNDAFTYNEGSQFPQGEDGIVKKTAHPESTSSDQRAMCLNPLFTLDQRREIVVVSCVTPEAIIVSFNPTEDELPYLLTWHRNAM